MFASDRIILRQICSENVMKRVRPTEPRPDPVLSNDKETVSNINRNFFDVWLVNRFDCIEGKYNINNCMNYYEKNKEVNDLHQLN
jgi:hypothetical protein